MGKVTVPVSAGVQPRMKSNFTLSSPMAEDAIAFHGLRIRERIRWIAFHKQLRGQTVLAGNRSPAMHVARTAGVDGGLDGAEQIFPAGSGQELADPLEVRVTISDGAVCVDVSAVVVCLPDLPRTGLPV